MAEPNASQLSEQANNIGIPFNEDDLCFEEMTPHELFMMSIPALCQLWDTPEEDAAWAHL